jgi:hypothetical protein
MPPLPDPEYSPEVVRYYLRHWGELVEMAQGTSNGMLGRSTGGSGGRITFVIIKADLERAADSLPWYWQATAFIFRRQRRSLNRPSLPETDRQYESPVPRQALDDAVLRMAVALGWSPIAQSAA